MTSDKKHKSVGENWWKWTVQWRLWWGKLMKSNDTMKERTTKTDETSWLSQQIGGKTDETQW